MVKKGDFIHHHYIKNIFQITVSKIDEIIYGASIYDILDEKIVDSSIGGVSISVL